MKYLILICLLLSSCTWLNGGNRAVRKALKTETPYCNDEKTYCVKLIDLKDSKVKALEIRIKETSMTLSTYDKMADAVTLEDRYQYLVTGTLEPKTIDVQIVDVKGHEASVCQAFCADYGQGNSGVIQDSMGVCICDNEEGRRAQEGYLRYIQETP